MTDEKDVSHLNAQQFFGEAAPGTRADVDVDGGHGTTTGGITTYPLKWPPISLPCPACAGERLFGTGPLPMTEGTSRKFINYECRNCRAFTFSYAVELSWTRGSHATRMLKIGQQPAFGPTLPAKLVKLLGPDRELLLKGRRAEAQGMGIAAFAYYRRVVDNQRARIFDAIIRASKRLNADAVLIEELESAMQQTRFTESVNRIKRALPESLLIEGHNPLTLLYQAVSEGLHNHTDDECLKYAGHVRAVLTAFVQRLDAALDENSELISAVQALLPKR
jgi:hypothetical protein